MNDTLIADALLVAAVERPYYRLAIAALTPIEEPRVRNLGVSRRWHLYWSPEWVANVGPAAAGRMIAAHMVEHLLRKHASRLSTFSFEPLQAHVAAELEINDDVPDGYLPVSLRPERFRLRTELTAEEYADEFEPWWKIHPADMCSGGSGVCEPFPWEGHSEESGGLSDDEQKILLDRVAADVRFHVATYGSVPAGVEIWADAQVKRPNFDWRHAFARIVSRVSRGVIAGRVDYSWRKLSRRRSEVLRPAMVRPKMRLAVVADTSGSMLESGNEVIGIVTTIAERQEARGGGGTDMQIGIAQALQMRCDAIVVVTDGLTPWGENPRVPVIGVIVGGGEVETPPWVRRVDVTPKTCPSQ